MLIKNCSGFLFAVSLLQFVIIVSLLYKLYDHSALLTEKISDKAVTVESFNALPLVNSLQPSVNNNAIGIGISSSLHSVRAQSSVININCPTEASVKVANATFQRDWNSLSSFRGAAVSLLLHAPGWFQRRYTMMIQNTHNNIPDDWVIQVFYTGAGQSLNGITINPGLNRLIASGRLRLTVIPKEVLAVKKKRFELMTELWIWQNMLSDRILLFGGGSVICSNSPHSINDFTHYDYIGTPWSAYKGVGGDGGISIRNRKLMVKIIEYALNRVPSDKRKFAYKEWGQEDHFFISTLLEMKKKNLVDWDKLVIATKNQSMTFGANGGYYNNDNWVVEGTLPDVPFKERDKFMSLCPEMKMFYPSLHDPNCFGASPDSEKCAKSICALKPRTERRGGC